MTRDEMILALRREMDRQGITDPVVRAGVGAIAGGESAFEMKPEMGYAHTVNARIRRIFGSRVAALTNAQLDALKANDVNFFNYVYGGNWGRQNLGNTEPGDGFRFRGRGMFQLTGRANYERIGKMIGVDLISDPEQADEPLTACAIAVAYIRDRYKGGGWSGIKWAVGNNIADIETTKNNLFEQYLHDNTFAPLVEAAPIQPIDPVVTAFKQSAERTQKFLRDRGFYKGALDGDWGPQSRSALISYLRSR